METNTRSPYEKFSWKLDSQDNWGDSTETNRTRGTVQKDWAVFDAYNLPEEFTIAVRAHKGWNHRPEIGIARYCLAVSFEVVSGNVPIYQLIESRIETEVETDRIRISNNT